MFRVMKSEFAWQNKKGLWQVVGGLLKRNWVVVLLRVRAVCLGLHCYQLFAINVRVFVLGCSATRRKYRVFGCGATEDMLQTRMSASLLDALPSSVLCKHDIFAMDYGASVQ